MTAHHLHGPFEITLLKQPPLFSRTAPCLLCMSTWGIHMHYGNVPGCVKPPAHGLSAESLYPCKQAPYSMGIRLLCATLGRALSRHLSGHLYLPLLCHCSRHSLFTMLLVCNLKHPGAFISTMGMCLGVSASPVQASSFCPLLASHHMPFQGSCAPYHLSIWLPATVCEALIWGQVQETLINMLLRTHTAAVLMHLIIRPSVCLVMLILDSKLYMPH